MNQFQIRIITLPDFYDGEVEAIHHILSETRIDTMVHLRKPGSTERQMRGLIEALGQDCRSQLILHDHLHLAVEYELGGIQLNNRCPDIPDGFDGLTGHSCHCADEVDRYAPMCDYVMLSPVFDSISKESYGAAFDSIETTDCVRRHPGKVIALGGVTPNRLTRLRQLGFAGAALHGCVWEHGLGGVAAIIRQTVCGTLGYLQYITHGPTVDTVAASVQAVLRGGCKWVQLRHKGDCTDELRAYALELSTDICPEYDAVCIVNDRIELVEECAADGVHLGKLDRCPTEARRLLGPDALIGATANTFDDILRAVHSGADYIGLGPFRFTDTKKNLSPILGLDGYREIMQRCRQAGITLPVVAIGGITLDDVDAIMQTGVSGIAVSGLLTQAAEPSARTAELLDSITKPI